MKCSFLLIAVLCVFPFFVNAQSPLWDLANSTKAAIDVQRYEAAIVHAHTLEKAAHQKKDTTFQALAYVYLADIYRAIELPREEEKAWMRYGKLRRKTHPKWVYANQFHFYYTQRNNSNYYLRKLKQVGTLLVDLQQREGAWGPAMQTYTALARAHRYPRTSKNFKESEAQYLAGMDLYNAHATEYFPFAFVEAYSYDLVRGLVEPRYALHRKTILDCILAVVARAESPYVKTRILTDALEQLKQARQVAPEIQRVLIEHLGALKWEQHQYKVASDLFFEQAKRLYMRGKYVEAGRYYRKSLDCALASPLRLFVEVAWRRSVELGLLRIVETIRAEDMQSWKIFREETQIWVDVLGEKADNKYWIEQLEAALSE